MFSGIFAGGLTINNFLVSMLVSFVCGLAVAFSYWIKNDRYTNNLLISLVMFPMITQAVIMIVARDNLLGVGIAIAGTFSLIRFRSVQGNSRDISLVFLSMAIGVATGVGQIFIAMFFTAVVCLIFVILKHIPFDKLKAACERELRITAPEDLDFEVEFAEILKRHTTSAQISSIRTSKMGSLYEVTYKIHLTNISAEKKLIDELRVKNGNLPIILQQILPSRAEEL